MRSHLLLAVVVLVVSAIAALGGEPGPPPAKADAQARETQDIEQKVAEIARQLSTIQTELEEVQTKLAARNQLQDAKLAQNTTATEEVTIDVEPALLQELNALDALRAGTSTNFDKADALGRDLLRRYHTPEQQGQIYAMLLQVHGQSGLITPERIIEYAQESLKYPLSSLQRSMVYIYWGDTLSVTRSIEPWPTQRRRAAEVYLQGAKDLLRYHLPETPPEFTEIPPPVDDSPDDKPALRALAAAQERYTRLWKRDQFLRQMIYQRDIFVRQIADMYARRGASDAEVAELEKRARETLDNETEVARLMKAVRAAAQPK